jgi:hypothetical protein
MQKQLIKIDDFYCFLDIKCPILRSPQQDELPKTAQARVGEEGASKKKHPE